MPSKEYIERGALREFLCEKQKGLEIAGCINIAKDFGRVIKLIDEGYIPTADVVEVVRCKKCVWWEPRVCGGTVGRCENLRNGLRDEYIDEDDYCSYGERKEQQ